MGWAADEAKRIADEKERLQKERDWSIRVGEIIKTEAPIIFDRLAGQIEADVDEFNAANGENVLRCERSSACVTVYKESFPTMTLELRFLENRNVIQLRRQSVPRAVSTSYDMTTADLLFSVRPDGSIFLNHSDHVRVAQDALRPVFAAFMPRR